GSIPASGKAAATAVWAQAERRWSMGVKFIGQFQKGRWNITA
ncbi:MAG: hypothetical protein ACI9TH_004682, partial [Kiritimatiellia bacterium]